MDENVIIGESQEYKRNKALRGVLLAELRKRAGRYHPVNITILEDIFAMHDVYHGI